MPNVFWLLVLIQLTEKTFGMIVLVSALCVWAGIIE